MQQLVRGFFTYYCLASYSTGEIKVGHLKQVPTSIPDWRGLVD